MSRVGAKKTHFKPFNFMISTIQLGVYIEKHKCTKNLVISTLCAYALDGRKLIVLSKQNFFTCFKSASKNPQVHPIFDIRVLGYVEVE